MTRRTVRGVARPTRTRLENLCSEKRLLSSLGETVWVGDQAVTHEARRQLPRRDALGDDLAALEACLRGDRLGGADLQARDRGRGRAPRDGLRTRTGRAELGSDNCLFKTLTVPLRAGRR